MTTQITKEQLRQFFERAEKAEQLAKALENQINSIKTNTAPQNMGNIDDNLREEVVKRLKTLKEEVVGIETRIQKLEEENSNLISERDRLNYRVRHMTEALKQYQKN